MGIGGVSIGSLLIVMVIVMLLFGTKRLRTIGTDLGGALSGFRKAVKEGEETGSVLALSATGKSTAEHESGDATKQRAA